MAATALLVTALLTQSAALPVADPAAREQSDIAFEEVAYEELASNRPEAAIAKIEASAALASRDPHS